MSTDDSLIAEAPLASAEEVAAAAVVKAGYISDYVSGQQIKATPEEVEATQVFSRRLVEDYSYPMDHI